MAAIELNAISKSFGDTSVLNAVDLTMNTGEFVTLVGPSGCGKSTLLRILAGLEHPDSGTVEIGGTDMTHVRPADRNLAMVFQSYALYPHLTVADNMMTPLKLRDLNRVKRLPFVGPLLARQSYRDLRAQVEQTADTLKISALLDRKPGQLSGGQRQRAALGRAMVRNPVAFLMDEPLSNLDAALRVHMRAELSELHRRLATTFVYVTHDQAEALTMSDRMAVMMHGNILQLGRPEDVYADPNCLDVARFVGSPSINTLPGEIDSLGRISLLGEQIGLQSASARQPVTLGLRPEHLRLDPQGELTGTLRHRENLGSDLFLHVVIDGGDGVSILRTTPAEATGLGIGADLRIGYDRAHVLCFAADGRRVGTTLPQSMEVA